MKRPVRKTIATAPTSPAPLHILLYTLPLWGCALLLMIAMPLTGVVSLLIISGCLFILPFKARRGLCPQCARAKTVPFSGFGSRCKGCGVDLVLRGTELHQIEPASQQPRPPYRGDKE